jgi:hypothetical protein
MGTAVARRSVWTAIAENPFGFFDAETFRFALADRLNTYAARVGGTLLAPPSSGDEGVIFRLQLSEIPFPDGPGHGSIEASAYRAYGRLSLSVIFEHDRLFRSMDGRSGSRLYLHDYKFVRSYGGDRPPEIKEIDEALDGVDRARHAVTRRKATSSVHGPLGRIRIAVRQQYSTGGGIESDAEDDARPPVAHRRLEVLEAIAAKRKRPGPVQTRKQRRPEDQDDG